MYLPTLLEFVNDEDVHIQLDGVEALCEVLEQVEQEAIEEEYIPQLLHLMAIEDQSEEFITRTSAMIGKIAAKLQKFDLHLKLKEDIINFYKDLIGREEVALRKIAVYNLPCMHLLYKSAQTELEINFPEIYQQFLGDEVQSIRECAASSLHEAFLLVDENEDSSKLRECLFDLLQDSAKPLMQILNKNLVTLIEKYANKHLLETFAAESTAEQSTDNSITMIGKKGTAPSGKPKKKNDLKSNNPLSKSSANLQQADFSAAAGKSQNGQRKDKSGINSPSQGDDDQSQQSLHNSHIQPEFQSEAVYSYLLLRLQVFSSNYISYEGMWRDHLLLINNLIAVLHLFYMPDFHEQLIPQVLILL